VNNYFILFYFISLSSHQYVCESAVYTLVIFMNFSFFWFYHFFFAEFTFFDSLMCYILMSTIIVFQGRLELI
jgi:hypothetical protein